MTGIAILLGAAAAGFAITRWLGVPAIPVLILLGAAASAPGVMDEEFLESAVVLGLTFMVFIAGIELNPLRVGRQKGAAIRVGLVQFLALGLAGLGASLLLGFSLQVSAYIAVALSVSSTLVVMRVLKGRQQLFEPYGRLVMGTLLLQDLLVILLIPVVTRLPEGSVAVVQGLLAVLGLVALSVVLLRWVTPRVVEWLSEDEESLLMVVLASLFVFLGLAALFDLPLLVGGFLAGVSLSAFPANAVVRGHLNSLSDFFLAIFFTSLGAYLLVPTVDELLRALALALVVLVVTPPVVAFIVERSGFSARPAVLSGLLLSQTSEFSLVVGLQGVVVGHIAQADFTIIALVTLFTMMVTPLVATDRVTWALLRIHPFRRAPALDPSPSDHVLLLGCGSNGTALLELLVVGPHQVVVVDDDPATVERLREGYIPAIRGDASDMSVLRAAGADRAKVIISTIRRPQDNSPVLALARERPVVVRAFNESEGEWIRARGAHPILYSEAAAEDFLDWYEATLEGAG